MKKYIIINYFPICASYSTLIFFYTHIKGPIAQEVFNARQKIAQIEHVCSTTSASKYSYISAFETRWFY